jgi:glutathione S-transferase
MIVLYNMPLALNCYKVRILLSLLNIEHQCISIDLLKDEHKTPEFLSLNPFGQLPVVTNKDLVLRDSQAILIWLARQYGNGLWLGENLAEEAEVNSWLSAAAFELRLGPYDARLSVHFPWLCVNANAVEENSTKALNIFEKRLTGRQWIALDRPTVADVASFPAIAQSTDGNISLEAYSAIQSWLQRMRKLPGMIELLD